MTQMKGFDKRSLINPLLVSRISFLRTQSLSLPPTADVLETGAKEVSAEAIIFRHDGKLYIVDAKPPDVRN